MTIIGAGPGAGGFVRIQGVPHHVVVEGGGPVCVLSAGLAMSWYDWEPVVPLLTPHRTVVRFDRPGHGLSGPAQAPPTAAGEAHRIAALLDALGLTAPATVVGHSIAGFHAEAFARLYPERTEGVVLVDSSTEPRARASSAPAVRTGATRALATALAAAGIPALLGPVARRALVRASRARRAHDPAPTPLVRRTYRTTRVLRGTLLENSSYLAVAAELLALRDTHPLPSDLPLTVLAAYDGRPTHPSVHWLDRQRDLADVLAARFEIVAGAGHLLMLDRPERVAEAVLCQTRVLV
ncbi:alpha/beta hydrolase [Streptomyces sp. NBC_00237]|uniref:alpha/beta fold hydrolase n=1 Tax=Streptomyces sp. NBC_00237 TaxID=2975687 RepID=UPI002259846A|nr:alpha/beta hydrolase [Streptomyces sp. NBC_00237]MCX5201611.1 alpha/beta hydrolase [Streptomyces sp. NBC_00237]